MTQENKWIFIEIWRVMRVVWTRYELINFRSDSEQIWDVVDIESIQVEVNRL